MSDKSRQRGNLVPWSYTPTTTASCPTRAVSESRMSCVRPFNRCRRTGTNGRTSRTCWNSSGLICICHYRIFWMLACNRKRTVYTRIVVCLPLKYTMLWRKFESLLSVLCRLTKPKNINVASLDKDGDGRGIGHPHVSHDQPPQLFRPL